MSEQRRHDALLGRHARDAAQQAQLTGECQIVAGLDLDRRRAAGIRGGESLGERIRERFENILITKVKIKIEENKLLYLIYLFPFV